MTSNKISDIAPLAALSLLLLSATVFAQDADRDGGKDHPVAGRYQGSYIRDYEQKEYEELRFLKPPFDVAETGSAKLTDAFSIPLSGRSTTIVYAGPKNRSILEVLTNYITKLSGAGFKVVGKCRGEECGLIGSNVWIQQLYFRGLHTTRISGRPIEGDNNSSTCYALLQKKSPSGDIWVSLYGSEYTRSGALTPNIAVSVLETKPMETGNMTFVDAVSMQEAIDKMGRVALYGIYFDFNKAEIKPESAKQIKEIAQLLQNKPQLKVLVVGHTDGRGDLNYNLELSEMRAGAVAEALRTRHAIAQNRLTPVGVGMAAPTDTNKTEEGRAKNRRVEIVER
jgi:OOP family OmpA-OmpF porin